MGTISEKEWKGLKNAISSIVQIQVEVFIKECDYKSR
jgi:hypothetical protein